MKLLFAGTSGPNPRAVPILRDTKTAQTVFTKKAIFQYLARLSPAHSAPPIVTDSCSTLRHETNSTTPSQSREEIGNCIFCSIPHS
jgi:hypothetical protein